MSSLKTEVAKGNQNHLYIDANYVRGNFVIKIFMLLRKTAIIILSRTKTTTEMI